MTVPRVFFITVTKNSEKTYIHPLESILWECLSIL